MLASEGHVFLHFFRDTFPHIGKKCGQKATDRDAFRQTAVSLSLRPQFFSINAWHHRHVTKRYDATKIGRIHAQIRKTGKQWTLAHSCNYGCTKRFCLDDSIPKAIGRKIFRQKPLDEILSMVFRARHQVERNALNAH